MRPDISVVIPIFNEIATLEELFARLIPTLEGMKRPYEVIAVDDGSTDGSFEMLKRLRDTGKCIRVIRLARNFGQNPALFAGFAHARGQLVATLDADLQNPPEELPKLIAKLEEGYDFVNGLRVGRKDSFFRMISSRLLNRIVLHFTGAGIHDYGCSLKAFRHEIVEHLARLTHHSRYLPLEAVKLGARVAEVEVGHCERAEGISKYGLYDLIRVNFDIITSITSVPLQFIGVVGWVLAVIGFAMAIRVLYVRLLYGDLNQLGTVSALLFIIAGVQLAATGFMCEYISRIFIEVQNRPYYVIGTILDAVEEDAP